MVKEVCNEGYFKMCCSSELGVLYDNEIIQIGIMLKVRKNSGTAQIYIGNKSTACITQVTTTILHPNFSQLHIDVNNSTTEGVNCGQG